MSRGAGARRARRAAARPRWRNHQPFGRKCQGNPPTPCSHHGFTPPPRSQNPHYKPPPNFEGAPFTCMHREPQSMGAVCWDRFGARRGAPRRGALAVRAGDRPGGPRAAPGPVPPPQPCPTYGAQRVARGGACGPSAARTTPSTVTPAGGVAAACGRGYPSSNATWHGWRSFRARVHLARKRQPPDAPRMTAPERS